jgi:hypothetical protein
MAERGEAGPFRPSSRTAPRACPALQIAFFVTAVTLIEVAAKPPFPLFS